MQQKDHEKREHSRLSIENLACASQKQKTYESKYVNIGEKDQMLTLEMKSVTKNIWKQFYIYTKQGSRNELVSIIPRGFTCPIYLRRSTTDIDNFVQIYLRKEYDFLPEPPKTILDIGGYIGLASTYLAKKYPNAKIVLAEPDPDNYIISTLNSRQFNNIECFNIAAWSRTCDLTIAKKIGGDWGTVVREVRDGEEVLERIKAMSIPDIMHSAKMEYIDFLKIDIEGSEKEIFSHSNAKEWIRKSKAISCELHDRFLEGCSNAFHDALKGEGFTRGSHGEYEFYIKS